jgi:hypothetical protein
MLEYVFAPLVEVAPKAMRERRGGAAPPPQTDLITCQNIPAMQMNPRVKTTVLK